jgi:polyisoprenoid-binding protein YceI
MTAQRSTPDRGPILMLIGIVVLAVAGAGVWYLFFRPAGPAPVSLGDTSTPSAVAAPTAGSAAPATAGASATPTPGSQAPAGSSGSGTPGGGIAGTWTVDASVGSFSDFSSSFVGYRVREELASIGAATAVGRTPGVTGTVTIDGTTVTAAAFTADLTSLQSDDPRRDGQLHQQALQTDQFPSATFKLTQPIDLGKVPADGETVSATATGDLTLHGVTKSVQVPLQARLANNVVTIVGSLPIQFADYGINPPRSMMVLSVENNGVLELQLKLTRAQG